MVDVLASFCPVHLGAEKDVRFSFCAGEDLCSSPYFLVLGVSQKCVCKHQYNSGIVGVKVAQESFREDDL